jgi:hypothetical protein
MRRTFPLVAAVVLAGALFVPTTVAAPSAADRLLPRAAEGTWSWVNTGWDQWKTTKKGVAYASGTEESTWTGTFEGTGVDTFGAQIWPDGRVWALLRISFTGTVDEKTGTLEILFTAIVNEPDQAMHGKWTIISGTDELANLRGQGTWVYVDADPTDNATYAGVVREFTPE